MSPVRKGTARGNVRLTQYETVERRRARDLRARAADADRRGQTEAAVTAWEELARLEPGDASVTASLMAAYDRAGAARRARDAERRAREAAVEAQQRALLALRREGQITAPAYAQALDVLGKDPAALTDDERALHGLLVDLLDGGITASHYMRSVTLLTAPPAESPPTVAPRPEPAPVRHTPAPPAVPPPRTAPPGAARSHAPGSAATSPPPAAIPAALAAGAHASGDQGPGATAGAAARPAAPRTRSAEPGLWLLRILLTTACAVLGYYVASVVDQSLYRALNGGLLAAISVIGTWVAVGVFTYRWCNARLTRAMRRTS